VIGGLKGGTTLLECLNEQYNSLSYQEKANVWRRWAKLGRRCGEPPADFSWNVEVSGARIVLPVRQHMFWLDWDLALSFLGHDIEVKMTYDTLLSLGGASGAWYDIGACHGLHSLFLLSRGCQVLSIEPNKGATSYLQLVAKANGLSCDVLPSAVGSTRDEARMIYPTYDPWLGSVCPETISRLRGEVARHGPLGELTVPVTTIDDVASAREPPRVMKLDIEGSEIEALKGARQVLRYSRPYLILESNTVRRRGELHALLNAFDYVVGPAPLLCSGWTPLSLKEFEGCRASNFAAVPC
jgi:FkbM family methyltransferase